LELEEVEGFKTQKEKEESKDESSSSNSKGRKGKKAAAPAGAIPMHLMWQYATKDQLILVLYVVYSLFSRVFIPYTHSPHNLFLLMHILKFYLLVSQLFSLWEPACCNL
jgi:hypothetical protein